MSIITADALGELVHLWREPAGEQNDKQNWLWQSVPFRFCHSAQLFMPLCTVSFCGQCLVCGTEVVLSQTSTTSCCASEILVVFCLHCLSTGQNKIPAVNYQSRCTDCRSYRRQFRTRCSKKLCDIQAAPLPGQPASSILFCWHHLPWGPHRNITLEPTVTIPNKNLALF